MSFIADAFYAELTFRRKLLDSAEAAEPGFRPEKGGERMRSEYDRPQVFIGSSSEGKRVAEFLQLGLHDEMETTIWGQGASSASPAETLESLVHATASYDFAVLVLTPDDLVESRGSRSNAPRDNVLLELGLFIGAIGRKRTFIVYPADEELALPSDLAGVTAATYRSRKDANLLAALGPVCTQIKVAARQVLGLPLDDTSEDAPSFEERLHVARRRRTAIPRNGLRGVLETGAPRRRHQRERRAARDRRRDPGRTAYGARPRTRPHAPSPCRRQGRPGPGTRLGRGRWRGSRVSRSTRKIPQASSSST